MPTNYLATLACPWFRSDAGEVVMSAFYEYFGVTSRDRNTELALRRMQSSHRPNEKRASVALQGRQRLAFPPDRRT